MIRFTALLSCVGLGMVIAGAVGVSQGQMGALVAVGMGTIMLCFFAVMGTMEVFEDKHRDRRWLKEYGETHTAWKQRMGID